jgi:hypothetical protein
MAKRPIGTEKDPERTDGKRSAEATNKLKEFEDVPVAIALSKLSKLSKEYLKQEEETKKLKDKLDKLKDLIRKLFLLSTGIGYEDTGNQLFDSDEFRDFLVMKNIFAGKNPFAVWSNLSPLASILAATNDKKAKDKKEADEKAAEEKRDPNAY